MTECDDCRCLAVLERYQLQLADISSQLPCTDKTRSARLRELWRLLNLEELNRRQGSGRSAGEAQPRFYDALMDRLDPRLIPFTRLEDPYLAQTIVSVLQDIFEGLEVCSVCFPQSPVQSIGDLPLVGTLPIWQLNALAINVPDSRRMLVALGGPGLQFLREMCAALLLSAPWARSGFSHVSVLMEPECLAMPGRLRGMPFERDGLDVARAVVGAYLRSRKIVTVEIEDDDLRFHAEKLFRACVGFMLGHELGHCALADHGTSCLARIGDQAFPVATVKRTEEAEFAADALGHWFALWGLGGSVVGGGSRWEGVEPQVTQGAVSLLFALLDHTDSFDRKFRATDKRGPSHPRPKLRMQRLSKLFRCRARNPFLAPFIREAARLTRLEPSVEGLPLRGSFAGVLLGSTGAVDHSSHCMGFLGQYWETLASTWLHRVVEAM